MWDLKYDTSELIYETETLTDMENKLTVTKGERNGGGINEGFGMHIHTQLYKNLKKNEYMPVQI